MVFRIRDGRGKIVAAGVYAGRILYLACDGNGHKAFAMLVMLGIVSFPSIDPEALKAQTQHSFRAFPPDSPQNQKLS